MKNNNLSDFFKIYFLLQFLFLFRQEFFFFKEESNWILTKVLNKILLKTNEITEMKLNLIYGVFLNPSTQNKKNTANISSNT